MNWELQFNIYADKETDFSFLPRSGVIVLGITSQFPANYALSWNLLLKDLYRETVYNLGRANVCRLIPRDKVILNNILEISALSIFWFEWGRHIL